MLPVFSFTQLLGIPRLNNVILSIIVIGLFTLFFKKIKLNESWIYSWLIGTGLLASLLHQLNTSSDFSYVNFIFPLTWLFLPFFINYWLSIRMAQRAKFCDLFFCLNFIYAFIQIFLVRFLGYSLMIHRYASDYTIPPYAQTTPFSYIGLTSIHQFISNTIGAAATGLLTERVDLMIICILCILRWEAFNRKEISYQISSMRSNGKYTAIEKFNLASAIILLTISGSSLSLTLLIFPILISFIRLSSFLDLKLKFDLINFSVLLRSLKNIFLSLFLIFFLLTFFLPALISLITFFDTSGRIAAIINLVSSLGSFSQNLDQVIFGSGVITTSSYDISSFLKGESLLPRSLDVIGYTFNSFGLFGLIPFITLYPLILLRETILRKESVIFFCLFAFAAAGSPINYVYIYAIILSLPAKHPRLVKV